jgi:hypothetical protein
MSAADVARPPMQAAAPQPMLHVTPITYAWEHLD